MVVNAYPIPVLLISRLAHEMTPVTLKPPPPLPSPPLCILLYVLSPNKIGFEMSLKEKMHFCGRLYIVYSYFRFLSSYFTSGGVGGEFPSIIARLLFKTMSILPFSLLIECLSVWQRHESRHHSL